MGKVFIEQWKKATKSQKALCAKLLDLQVEQVERIIMQRIKLIRSAQNKQLDQ